MAKRNHTRDVPPSKDGKQERFLTTVLLYPESIPRKPWIRLHGHWLQQARFSPQTSIRVRVMTGSLVITTEGTP